MTSPPFAGPPSASASAAACWPAQGQAIWAVPGRRHDQPGV